ncbi:hypothetical protein BTA51_27335 [Hahella sp. CCB-MM4]|nr:hypothetical protein BTA51_27335 [Hahella sp. CCB-MM4]
MLLQMICLFNRTAGQKAGCQKKIIKQSHRAEKDIKKVHCHRAARMANRLYALTSGAMKFPLSLE